MNWKGFRLTCLVREGGERLILSCPARSLSLLPFDHTEAKRPAWCCQVFSHIRLGHACALTMLPVSPAWAQRKDYSCLHVPGPDLQRHWAPPRKAAEQSNCQQPRFSSLCKHLGSLLINISRKACLHPSLTAWSWVVRPSWKTSKDGEESKGPCPSQWPDREPGA